MGERFTVEVDMTPEDRKTFDAFIVERLPKVNQAVEWAQAKGYRIPRSSVHRYMRKLKTLEEIRKCADASAAIVAEKDTGELVDATRKLMRQRLFETLYRGVKKGEFKAGDIKDLTAADKNMAQREAIELEIKETERKRLAEIAAAEMKKLQGKVTAKKAITDEDIAEVRKAVFG